jgi:hypothetical protein
LLLLLLQIVDMELPEGQSILGARLLQLPNSSRSSSDSESGNAAAAAAAEAGPPLLLLLLLTQKQLICYQLKPPA